MLQFKIFRINCNAMYIYINLVGGSTFFSCRKLKNQSAVFKPGYTHMHNYNLKKSTDVID